MNADATSGIPLRGFRSAYDEISGRLFVTTAGVLLSGLRSPAASGSIVGRVRRAVTGPSSATPAASC